MLLSLPIFNRFRSHLGFYISWPILIKYMIPHQISDNLNHIKSQLISKPMSNQSCSNFGFYISWPILTNYLIPGNLNLNPNLNMNQTKLNLAETQLKLNLVLSCCHFLFLQLNQAKLILILWLRWRLHFNRFSFRDDWRKKMCKTWEHVQSSGD